MHVANAIRCGTFFYLFSFSLIMWLLSELPQENILRLNWKWGSATERENCARMEKNSEIDISVKEIVCMSLDLKLDG